jgi:phosphatidylinositol alpha-1,6-mannosyltransferase
MVRVLALVTDAFGGYGGIARYNRDMVEALAALPAVQAVEVLPRLAADCETTPPKVRQHPAIHPRSVYAMAALHLALRIRPTIVFNGHIYHGPLCRIVAALSGAKLVSQLHGTEVWDPLPKRLLKPAEASDLVLAVSRDTREKLLSQSDLDPARVRVVNNTVGAGFTPGDRRAARARFGLNHERVVLTVARLDGRGGYKGHDRIIPLIARLRGQGAEVLYLIAGTGADRPRLEALAAAHGVQDHVRFLGRVPQEDLPDLYRAADLFALPSTGEGFGIAFLEAMACGTPAIGLAVGGAPDALADGELGACVSEAQFPRAFEDALAAATERPATLADAVQRRFGLPAFRTRVAEVVEPLWRTTRTTGMVGA